MMKTEFENLAGREVTDEQYRAIETLYMSSNLEKTEFVKSMKPILKNIPQPEKKKDIKRMVVRDRSGYRKTPNGCYYHIEYVELVDIDIKTGKYIIKPLEEKDFEKLAKDGHDLNLDTWFDFDYEDCIDENKGQFFGYKDTTHEVKVFYIEKWWGNRWDRINGLLMVGGEILAKMTPPYNLTGKDFEKVGITFASSGSGWQKGTKSSRFGRIVNSIGGSSSTYTCDYFWWNAGITAVALVGGSCGSGDFCGADCLYLNFSAGNAGWSFGASVFLEQPIAA